MTLKAQFELMATYNTWMNKKLFDAASKLSSDQLSEDRGAFFGSVIATLNHILVGDTLWLTRFAKHPAGFASLAALDEFAMPNSLDAIMHSQFDQLLQARVSMDKLIQAFTGELSNDVLSGELSYRNTKGQLFSKSFASLLLHLFNHQTHHRGQVSTLLSQAGISLGATDLVMLIADE